MGKRIFGSITELSSVAFSIENVTMMRTNVIPPASFKCRKGWRKICRFFYVIHELLLLIQQKESVLLLMQER